MFEKDDCWDIFFPTGEGDATRTISTDPVIFGEGRINSFPLAICALGLLLWITFPTDHLSHGYYSLSFSHTAGGELQQKNKVHHHHFYFQSVALLAAAVVLVLLFSWNTGISRSLSLLWMYCASWLQFLTALPASTMESKVA